MVADMVADMEVHMVAYMEVGKVADKVVYMVADMAFLVGGSDKKMLTNNLFQKGFLYR